VSTTGAGSVDVDVGALVVVVVGSEVVVVSTDAWLVVLGDVSDGVSEAGVVLSEALHETNANAAVMMAAKRRVVERVFGIIDAVRFRSSHRGR
jgi:hypothetical protein